MKDLLDFLAKQLDCTYLSDLPTVYNQQIFKESIEKIDINEYSLDNWNETIKYIIKTDKTFTSIADAKTYLTSKCK
ncbi:MAG: hypothetical protein RSB05_06860 [Clostridiales bacterium]